VLRITQATTQNDIQEARQLFKEYETALGISLCFQNFEQELAGLPGDYALPHGRLLLAREDDQVMACIALRPLGPTTCEMKRLFVRPEYRDRGLGRVLVEAIIEEARKIGYTHMRLDTIADRMDRAVALYRSIGFVEIPPYRENPVDSATFMELDLLTPKH
jgi:ribosomal protein S18 acetylase RimI-like enzyme